MPDDQTGFESEKSVRPWPNRERIEKRENGEMYVSDCGN